MTIKMIINSLVISTRNNILILSSTIVSLLESVIHPIFILNFNVCLHDWMSELIVGTVRPDWNKLFRHFQKLQ
jgi:hypothetical protein